MAANYSDLTRSIDLTGLSGNPTALDPLFAPMEGVALSTLTYSSGVVSIANGASSAIWLLRAIPLAAYWTPSSGTIAANSVEVDLEIRTSDATTYAGGVMFYSYSKDLFLGADGLGMDGDAYYFTLNPNGANYDLYRFRRNEGAATQEGSTVSSISVTGGGWTRFRFTLTGTSSTKTIKVERYDVGSWTQLSSDNCTHLGNAFGVALRVGGSRTAQVRSISVTWKGPAEVWSFIGQSELSGYADTQQTSSDGDLISINRSNGAPVVCSDPWEIAPQTANSVWTGVLAEPTSGVQNSGYPYGSAMPNFAALLKAAGASSVAFNSMGVRGGSSITSLVPGANAWDITTLFGASELMTHTLAGDGRTTGQALKFGLYHTTGNMNSSGWTGVADKAAYKTELQKIYTRCLALWPTSIVRQAEVGDRTWRYPTQAVMNGELRAAHQEIWAANANGARWFDESTLTGDVGSGQGWAHLDSDGFHPGVEDNVSLSQLMAGTYVTPGTGDGILPFITPGARMMGRGR